MIFDIALHYEDADTKVVILDMALEDYSEESWRVALVLDKTQLDVPARLADFDKCESNDDTYYTVPRNNVPEWVKRLAQHLQPRMFEVMTNGGTIRSFC